MREPSPLEEEEYRQLRRELTKAVVRICPRWLSDAVEDLVQAALVRVLELRRRREENVELSSFYLRKVAFSALIDEIRRRGRRPEVPLATEDGEIDPPAEGTADPERRLAGRQLGRAIYDCLATLVVPRRRALALHLQGHSVPDIGRILGFRTKQADNLVYRGMADLRSCLGRRGITP